jgi:hypothetical protein
MKASALSPDETPRRLLRAWIVVRCGSDGNAIVSQHTTHSQAAVAARRLACETGAAHCAIQQLGPRRGPEKTWPPRLIGH